MTEDNMILNIDNIERKHAHLGYIQNRLHDLGVGWVARIKVNESDIWLSPHVNADVYIQEWYDTDLAWRIWNDCWEGGRIELYHAIDEISCMPWSISDSDACPAPFTPETLSKRIYDLEKQIALQDARIVGLMKRVRANSWVDTLDNDHNDAGNNEIKQEFVSESGCSDTDIWNIVQMSSSAK